jgi:hypothetical protein
MIMRYRPDNDKDSCLPELGSILIADPGSGRRCFARLNSMSCHGMFFEAEDAFEPGSMIEIQFEKAPTTDQRKKYRATVYWCMLLTDQDCTKSYGIGVKYIRNYGSQKKRPNW